MQHTLIHFAPVRSGERPNQHPDNDDPRFAELTSVLVQFGLVTADGKCAKQFTMIRGSFKSCEMHAGGAASGEVYFFVWRLTWRE